MNGEARAIDVVSCLTGLQVPLRLYVQSLLPGDPAAKDVTQHANTTIWNKRAEFIPTTNFKAWAFAIVRYEVRNYRKRQARGARWVFSEDLEETFADELAGLEDDMELRLYALQSCLERLPPKHRDFLMHRYGSPGTLQEYLEKTGHSVGRGSGPSFVGHLRSLFGEPERARLHRHD